MEKVDKYKSIRQQIDLIIQQIEGDNSEVLNGDEARAQALVRTKLQEAKMWGGKCLEAIGRELPPEFQDKAQPDVLGSPPGQSAE